MFIGFLINMVIYCTNQNTEVTIHSMNNRHRDMDQENLRLQRMGSFVRQPNKAVNLERIDIKKYIKGFVASGESCSENQESRLLRLSRCSTAKMMENLKNFYDEFINENLKNKVVTLKLGDKLYDLQLKVMFASIFEFVNSYDDDIDFKDVLRRIDLFRQGAISIDEVSLIIRSMFKLFNAYNLVLGCKAVTDIDNLYEQMIKPEKIEEMKRHKMVVWDQVRVQCDRGSGECLHHKISLECDPHRISSLIFGITLALFGFI